MGDLPGKSMIQQSGPLRHVPDSQVRQGTDRDEDGLCERMEVLGVSESQDHGETQLYRVFLSDIPDGLDKDRLIEILKAYGRVAGLDPCGHGQGSIQRQFL